MSGSRRDHINSSNTSSSKSFRNGDDDDERYSRKRSHVELDNIDAKVYVGNISTEKLTDQELLDFFNPYGKIADIRVFKDHVFVQYNRIDDAKCLIKKAKSTLVLKGRKLDVLPARDIRSTSTKSSSTDRSSKRSLERTTRQHSSSYESSGKRFLSNKAATFSFENLSVFSSGVGAEANSREDQSSSRFEANRTNSDSSSRHHQSPYTTLTGPTNSNDLVDCQIIIVNARQRAYADDIESRLGAHGLVTSIILLREDFTLTEAVESAARLQCLYAVVAMPLHEERRTASFHILYGQTEEHRNLTLDDGLHILVSNFIAYKERVRNDETEPFNENNDSTDCSESKRSFGYVRSSRSIIQEEVDPPLLTLDDRLPLSMLLCLLADGRQLTLEEIDRVLVYLLEKKAKMLTLPAGTLPPLPAQYATKTIANHPTVSEARALPMSDSSYGKSSSSEVSSSIAEQIRQILSSNIAQSNVSVGETNLQPNVSHTSLNKLSDIVKVENTSIVQSNSSITEVTKDLVQQQQQQQQQKTPSSFPCPKVEALPAVSSTLNYSSQSVSTAGPLNAFGAPNFSTYSPIPGSLTLNSALKATASSTVPNFVSQTSQYFYQMPTQSVYSSPLNSTVTDAAAGIFQAYSQFNVQPTANSSMVGQQINAQQQLRP